jgi:hypothetical protein
VRRSRVAFAFACAGLCCAGCGPAQHPDPRPRDEAPERAVERYLAAVRAGRFDEAYGLMSSSYRRDHDRAGFVRSLGEHTAEVQAAAARLAAGAASVELRAEARYGDGDTLPLTLEGGAWHLAGDPLDFYPQATPLEALRSFLRAIERRRYDVAWRFVPSRYRKEISVADLRARWEGDKAAELQAEIAEVRAHLAEPFELRGSEARLALGGERAARLVREEGQWRVEALK